MAAELEKRLNQSSKWQYRMGCAVCKRDSLWTTERSHAQIQVDAHNERAHPVRTYEHNDYDAALAAFELALAEAAADSGMEPDQIAYDIMDSLKWDTEPGVYAELRRTQL